jgi:P-type Ca2+ transporter type 2C
MAVRGIARDIRGIGAGGARLARTTRRVIRREWTRSSWGGRGPMPQPYDRGIVTGDLGAAPPRRRGIGPARDSDRELTVEGAHGLEAAEVVNRLRVDPDEGLGTSEVHRRRRLVGRNALRERGQVTKRRILLDQVRSAVVALLAAAVVAGLAIGEIPEAVAVAVVLVANTVVGFVTELRAVRSMEALRRLAATIADVERHDRRDEIDAVELVPGDIVSVEAGDRVPADLRIIEATDLDVDESPLTGESHHVAKDPAPVAADAPLAERTNMLYLGTTVRSGRSRGVVVATGSRTEVGRISELAETAETMQAPLQAGLERLGRTLSVVVVVLAGALAGLGLVRGLDVREVVEVSIALAVAIVPEGLPAVATLTLTVGMRRMARAQALVRRLPVVETLGSTTVIASDKTGTLTANEMRVVDHVVTEGATVGQLWESATLCNDADVAPDGDPVGDPTEVALLLAAGMPDWTGDPSGSGRSARTRCRSTRQPSAWRWWSTAEPTSRAHPRCCWTRPVTVSCSKRRSASPLGRCAPWRWPRDQPLRGRAMMRRCSRPPNPSGWWGSWTRPDPRPWRRSPCAPGPGSGW